MKLLLWAVALLVAWFFLPLLIDLLDAGLNVATLGLNDFSAGMRERLQDLSFAAFQRTYQKHRRHGYGRYLQHASPAGISDEQLVEAIKLGPPLRRLVFQKLPGAIKDCLKTHRLLAEIDGAEVFEQIAYEPECVTKRFEVVEMTEAAIDLMASYPLLERDRDLLKASMLLRKKLYPCCSDCPHLQETVATAPVLCPAAKLANLTEQEVLT